MYRSDEVFLECADFGGALDICYYKQSKAVSR
ncbi:MAG: hypothetical protein QOH70_945 [Blastocatellia bacterium]|jgi:hypothetical protein|nr:hypothetical protein [Blastocatellia bacterium]